MRLVTVVIAAVLVVPAALAVLGTYLYAVPYLGLATAYVPWYLPWLVVATVAGGVLAATHWRMRRGRIGAVLAVVAVLTVAGASVIDARMIAAVEHAGADINLIDTFGVGVPKYAAPDEQVTYGSYQGTPLPLSVYRPPESASYAPVLVYIHGGGWVAGDLTARSADLRWFAERGWLVVSIDYTLSSADRHLWDVTQDQIGCALGWVVANAPKYGGDPTRISVSGHSAGGNLAINTGYLAAAGRLRSSCGGTMPRVAAVSAVYPVVDPAGFYDNRDPALGGRSRGMVGAYTGGSPQQFPDRYAAIASDTHISAAAPPTLVIVGEADHLVPVDGTHRFVAQARAAGVDVELVAVPYADHVFDGRRGSIGEQAYRQLTARWLRDHGSHG
ncbi:MAG TPA: alpha/beta hydrolase [Mycobacterium sp.]|nr:alpha/beta hydrolase [Mycobacterium sp.]